MYKRHLINFLFILSFPIYGIGTYISGAHSPSMGFLISASTHVLIILFYCIDIVSKREFRVRINATYIFMVLYLGSCIFSLFVALGKGLPETNLLLTVTRSLLLIVPFHAFVVVVLYNDSDESAFPRLLIWSLSLMLVFNLAGYFVLGLSNVVHSIEGRLNFPFLDGFYSGAGLLAIINLMLLPYMKKAWTDPVLFTTLAAYFTLNLTMFLMINSRLTILLFLFVLALFLVGLLRVRGLFLFSMFTLPILLSSGLILYEILNLPALSSMMQRIDIEDVTTFNGRAFLWKDVIDWLAYDRRGLIFGNGYKGHYFLDLLWDVAKLWDAKDPHHLHLHSTSLEVLVSQGLVFLVVLCILFHQVYHHFKRKHKKGTEAGSFFGVVIFLLFIMQVDTFVYLDSLGFVIFAFLAAITAVKEKRNIKAGIQLVKPTVIDYSRSHEYA